MAPGRDDVFESNGVDLGVYVGMRHLDVMVASWVAT
jgi:hypothetical protein